MPQYSLSYVYLALAIGCEVLGTSFLKGSEGFTRLWPSVNSTLGYALAFYFLSLTLRTIPMGIAYAIWSGTGMVLIALIGWLWQGQELDWPAFTGMGFIVLGVLVIQLFSETSGH